MYKQGVYIPANASKYRGNHRNIFYRSSWEKIFMRWCDRNQNIIEWGSEEFFIPYRAPDGKVRRYYPDFYIKVREQTGELKKYIIEIKPDKQTRAPVQGKKTKKQFLYESNTFLKNQAKWKAARKYCKKRQAEFLIFTEKELGIRI
tara:strand:- start:411 stop:848 length:438 start_codon:yes stop_codon:yes gene_type:complete